MKLITENEKNDHKSHIMKEGSKGFLIGSVIGLGLIRYFKFKQPLKYNSFNWTVKACLYTMPTLGFTAFLTDNGGTQFSNLVIVQLIYNRKSKSNLNNWTIYRCWKKSSIV